MHPKSKTPSKPNDRHRGLETTTLRQRYASAGLEREAEAAWREAETWIAHEEALERREASLAPPPLDADDDASPASPQSWASAASLRGGAALRQPSHFLPASPRRADGADADGDDDDDGDDAWALALHRHVTAPASPRARFFFLLSRARPRPRAQATGLAMANSPSRSLHEKLSSPHRKPPSPAETKRRQEARQVAAQRLPPASKTKYS